jgi:PAS domain S-box-containing protein
VIVQDLLNTLPCGFVTFAHDGVVIAANQTLLDMLGYSHEEVLQKPVEQLFSVGTRIFYQTHWFPLLVLHGHAEEVFLQLRTRTGEVLGVLSYARQRRATTGPEYDCVLVHVRERAKYEDELLRAKRAAEESNARLESKQRELQQANEQLEAQAVELELQQEEAEQLRVAADNANKAKSTFLATMSHELRTPLNAISGYLQILEAGIAGPLTDRQLEIITRIDKSGHHLLRLINEVLNLAKIEAGMVDYDITDVSAKELVSEVVPLVEPQFASKHIRLSVEVDPRSRVSADAEKVQQILLNLLSNAVKFTSPNGTVEILTRPDGTGDLLLMVKDNGIGIPAEQLESVFAPFVQVDSSHSRKVEGTGLGLAISRDLARGMGGDLWAESTLGAGSTFTLKLPAAHDKG